MTFGVARNLSYIELLTAFPPRSIRSEEQLSATQKVINTLIDQGNLTPDEREYLNLLGAVVYEYEEEHYPLPEMRGVELMKALLAAFNLSPKDLIPIFETESMVEEILNSKTKPTPIQVEKLADFFIFLSLAF